MAKKNQKPAGRQTTLQESISEITGQPIEEMKTFHEAAAENKDVVDYVRQEALKMAKRKDDFVREKVEKHFTKKELKDFQKFRELDEYFNGSAEKPGIVKMISKGETFEDMKFGIKIHGEEHWMSIKEEVSY